MKGKKMNADQVKHAVTITDVKHNETAWDRDVSFNFEGESYSILLHWDIQDGYEVADWGNTPIKLRESADGYICSILDDLSTNFSEVN